MICNNCNSTIPDHLSVCPVCGKRIPLILNYCKKCGTFIEKNDTFCKRCGAQKENPIKNDSNNISVSKGILLSLLFPLLGVIYALYIKRSNSQTANFILSISLTCLCAYILSIASILSFTLIF